MTKKLDDMLKLAGEDFRNRYSYLVPEGIKLKKQTHRIEQEQLDRLIALGVDLTFQKQNKCPFCGPNHCCNNPQCEYRKEYLNESQDKKSPLRSCNS
jgi:hypothetical protein